METKSNEALKRKKKKWLFVTNVAAKSAIGNKKVGRSRIGRVIKMTRHYRTKHRIGVLLVLPPSRKTQHWTLEKKKHCTIFVSTGDIITRRAPQLVIFGIFNGPFFIFLAYSSPPIRVDSKVGCQMPTINHERDRSLSLFGLQSYPASTRSLEGQDRNAHPVHNETFDL